MKTKVVIALSGGVDSSVAAALLQQQGYEVVGVTLKLWSEPGTENENRCCTPQSRQVAALIADQLGIPFHVFNTSDLFYQKVVTPFLEGYRQNETPNPCVFCNRFLKWGYLMEYARSIAADYVATGHYAQIHTAEDGSYHLCKAVDPHKDQSYFLCQLDQPLLAHTLFPLGAMNKTRVRQIARELDLPVAEQPDSQDLCFLTGGDLRSFLTRYIPDVVHPGPITNRQGKTLGEHNGLAFYTIGQRKGLPAAERPLYVLEKDGAQNRLVVGFAAELGRNELTVREVNWASGKIPENPFAAEVRIRSRAAAIPAKITPLSADRCQIAFSRPLRDITPGQMAVFYQDQIVLGGGFIEGR